MPAYCLNFKRKKERKKQNMAKRKQQNTDFFPECTCIFAPTEKILNMNVLLNVDALYFYIV